MEALKTCPSCHTENSPSATLCEHCGTPLVALLPSPTIQVPEMPIRQVPQEHVSTVSALEDNVLALFVVGYDRPILVNQHERVSLGRYSPGEMAPTVDLMPYNGDIMGVSRQHAVIYVQDGRYVIEDLGSTNGTWLNENRLAPNTAHPLNSGTLLRLGQLGLYAYFSTFDKISANLTEVVNLKPGLPGLSRLKFTPYNLAKHISPYLSGLAGIQAVCDEINDLKPSEIVISSISVSSNLLISVHIEGGKDAIRFSKGKLALWRDQYAGQVAQALEIARSLAQGANLSETTQKFRNAGEEIKRLRQELQDAEQQLAVDYLNEFAAQHPLEKRRMLLPKFIQQLHTLTFSTLQVAVD
jgi:exonuclease VII small subunit